MRDGKTVTCPHCGSSSLDKLISAPFVSSGRTARQAGHTCCGRAVCIFGRHGLETRVGEMSTLVWGEERAVFAALEEAFRQTAERGDTVMAVTFSNACPSPQGP